MKRSRDTLLRQDFFGLDSVQGYLELGNWYNASKVRFGATPSDRLVHGSLLHTIEQLTRDGYLEATWSESRKDGSVQLTLDQISLTVSGHKLLEEARRATRWHGFRKRAVDLLWVIATTICTTLLVMYIKGS